MGFSRQTWGEGLGLAVQRQPKGARHGLGHNPGICTEWSQILHSSLIVNTHAKRGKAPTIGSLLLHVFTLGKGLPLGAVEAHKHQQASHMKLGLKSEPVPCDCVILADLYHWWLCKCRGCKISKQITGAPMAGGSVLAVAGFVGTHTQKWGCNLG